MLGGFMARPLYAFIHQAGEFARVVAWHLHHSVRHAYGSSEGPEDGKFFVVLVMGREAPTQEFARLDKSKNSMSYDVKGFDIDPTIGSPPFSERSICEPLLFQGNGRGLQCDPFQGRRNGEKDRDDECVMCPAEDHEGEDDHREEAPDAGANDKSPGVGKKAYAWALPGMGVYCGIDHDFSRAR